MRTMMLAAALAVLAGAASAQTTPERYALDVTVHHDGVQTIGSHSIVTEELTTEVSFNDGINVFQVVADLNPVQGDGDDETLALSLNISRNNDAPVQPHLTLKRGRTAQIMIGTGPGGHMMNGVTVTLSPVAPRD